MREPLADPLGVIGACPGRNALAAIRLTAHNAGSPNNRNLTSCAYVIQIAPVQFHDQGRPLRAAKAWQKPVQELISLPPVRLVSRPPICWR